MPSKIEKFAGLPGEDVMEWFERIDSLLKAHNCAENQKVETVVWNLSGAASLFARSLPPEIKQNYKSFKDIMKKQYSLRDPEILFHMQLMGRSQSQMNLWKHMILLLNIYAIRWIQRCLIL